MAAAGVFRHVVDALVATRGQYTVLNSALLELLEYIRVQPTCEALLEHIAELHGERLRVRGGGAGGRGGGGAPPAHGARGRRVPRA